MYLLIFLVLDTLEFLWRHLVCFVSDDPGEDQDSINKNSAPDPTLRKFRFGWTLSLNRHQIVFLFAKTNEYS